MSRGPRALLARKRMQSISVRGGDHECRDRLTRRRVDPRRAISRFPIFPHTLELEWQAKWLRELAPCYL